MERWKRDKRFHHHICKTVGKISDDFKLNSLHQYIGSKLVVANNAIYYPATAAATYGDDDVDVMMIVIIFCLIIILIMTFMIMLYYHINFTTNCFQINFLLLPRSFYVLYFYYFVNSRRISL